MTHASIRLEPAGQGDRNVLLPLVRAYHEFDHVAMSDAQRDAAVGPLLESDSPWGRIWLIRTQQATAGYVALCFGYSIEFRGRDAFIDELFVIEAFRGQGVGGAVLERVKTEAEALGIRALHLEVARDNERARRLYEKGGFRSRTRFHLMSCYLDTRDSPGR